MASDLISVLPKNYRAIVLAAIATAQRPVVYLDRAAVTDFSEDGPLTQRGLAAARDFEIRDGQIPILGFHDHPREMWIAAPYAPLAAACAEAGWLRIE